MFAEGIKSLIVVTSGIIVVIIDTLYLYMPFLLYAFSKALLISCRMSRRYHHRKRFLFRQHS